jgi:hypothetical protein
MKTTATNKTTTVSVSLEGECLGYNAEAKTCVRPTTCGQFAVMKTVPNRSGGYRLIKLFADSNYARNYNNCLQD